MSKPEDDLQAAHLANLSALAEAFLEAGGVYTHAEWKALSDDERAAAHAAGRRLARKRALMLGAAIRGGLEAAIVQAPLDAGDALEDLLLTRALEGGPIA